MDILNSLCAIIVGLALFLGLPISIIWLIIRLFKKKSIKPLIISACSCIGVTVIFSILGSAIWSRTDDYQEYLVDKQAEQESMEQAKLESIEQSARELAEKEPIKNKNVEEAKSATQKSESEPSEKQIDKSTQEHDIQESAVTTHETTPEQEIEAVAPENQSVLTEEEYKAQCEELWHDDIFFSEDNLEGKFVKLDLFVEEERFYDAGTVMYNIMVSDFLKEYDVKRTFYFCGVNRKDEIASYMGGQVSLYIPNDFDMELTIGDHLIFYGEIIDYSTMSWDGYNSCYLLPKFIVNNG